MFAKLIKYKYLDVFVYNCRDSNPIRSSELQLIQTIRYEPDIEI